MIASVEEGGKPIQALDVSRDGNKVVIGSTGNFIKIVTLTWTDQVINWKAQLYF